MIQAFHLDGFLGMHPAIVKIFTHYIFIFTNFMSQSTLQPMRPTKSSYPVGHELPPRHGSQHEFATDCFRNAGRSKIFLFSLVTLVAVQASNDMARAASATWTGAVDGNWNNAGNWNPGVPGASSGTTNQDIATFNNNINTTVAIDPNRTMRGIYFTGNAGAFTIGATNGNAIRLIAGEISLQSTFAGSNTVETINAPLELYSTALIQNLSSDVTNSLRIGGSITVAAGVTGTVTMTLRANVDQNNVISGSISDGPSAVLSILKQTGGTWTLAGDNSHSGGTNLAAGKLNLNSAKALGTGLFTVVDSTSFDNTSGSSITLTTNNGHLWMGNLTFVGSNDLNLGTGAVSLGNVGGRATSTLTISARQLTVGGAISNGTLGTGIFKAGSGTLTLSGANNYTGGTTLNTGQLNINNAQALGSGTFTIAAGVTFDNTSGAAVTLTTNNAQTWNSNISFKGTNDLNLGTGAVNWTAGNVITVNGGVLTVGGAITKASASTFNKQGAGTLVLSGNNSYTSTTTVTAGTLLVNGGHFAAGAYTVNSGATLGGSGSISTALNAGIVLSSGAKLSPGGLTSLSALTLDLGTGQLNLTSAINSANSQSLIFRLDTPASSDKVLLQYDSVLNIGTGLLEFDDFVFTLISPLDFGQYVYTLFETEDSAIIGSLGSVLSGTIEGHAAVLSRSADNTRLELTLNVVPEPGASMLLLLGLGLINRVRIRRKR